MKELGGLGGWEERDTLQIVFFNILFLKGKGDLKDFLSLLSFSLPPVSAHVGSVSS